MSNRLPITFIMITMVIDAMGIGLILPVMPSLLEEVTDGTLGEAARWGGILSGSFAAMQFLFGPTVGNLSDRYGRRPILLISLVILAVNYLVMATADSIGLLLALQLIGGMMASTQTVCMAFMADISKPEEKAANFGLIGAAFGVGFVLGPLIGGQLAEFGTRAPFLAAAVLAALNFVFGALVLKETLTEDRRRPFEWARANPIGAFGTTGKLPGISRLLALLFTYEFAFFVYPSVWAYYTTARFGWEPGMIGLSLAAFGISMALVQALLVGPIVRWMGARGAIFYGLSVNSLCFLGLGLLESGLLVLLLTPLTALGAVVSPAANSIMSRTVPDDAQGELQGLIASARSIAVIFSPFVMTNIFAAFSEDGAPIFLPGAPFLLSMVLMGVCAAIMLTPRQRAIP